MFKKLIEFNWSVFKSKLTSSHIIVLVVYGALLLLLFYSFINIVLGVVSMQNNPLLYQKFPFLNPQRARLLLLIIINALWISQLIFTSGRQLQLQENRKLLTVGYPLFTLARHLNIMGFLHPVNLLFNTIWLVLLYQLAPGPLWLPLILVLVVLNFGIIFSIKFRFLHLLKGYHKWIFVILGTIFFLAAVKMPDVISAEDIKYLDPYLSAAIAVLSWLPGGLIQRVLLLSTSATAFITVFIVSAFGCYILARDHIKNTRRGLQTPAGSEVEKNYSNLLRWLCRSLGNESGKYVFYVITHPYNRIQALFLILIPLVYIPLATHNSGEGFELSFLILFFLMYIPLGFLMLSTGNIFGYEHRELLLHLQSPTELATLIKARVTGALVLPAGSLIIICLLELILLNQSPHLFSFMVGNVFVFLSLMLVFLWSSFHHFQKIPWVSFSFTQPVISKSVAMVSGLAMFILSILAFVPFGRFEIYKLAVLSAAILIMAGLSYQRYKTIHRIFKTTILPRLWTEQ